MPTPPIPSTNPGPGRPKSAKKRSAILDAAKHLFLAFGFDGVSVEQIASAAGVSKLTVYSHFTDKEALFFEAVKARCQEQLPDDLFAQPPAGPIDQALRSIGHRFHALLASSDAISLQRMMLADPRNVEHLGTLFWNAGPARIIAGLEAFLRAATQRGELDIQDTREAAGQFLCLLKGEVNLRMLCGPVGCMHGDDTTAHVDSVVTLFLRAYRAGRS